jgi:hypothetical protein
MDKIDPNHDIVPTLRMMDGLLFDKAADEIEKWRDAYRKAVQTPAAELMIVGPGWHERFPVITPPIVIDGLLQVHVSDRRDDMADELTRLRAENAALIAERAAPVQPVQAQPAIDLSRCTAVLIESGKAHPRTCEVCKLGPCRRGVAKPVQATLPDGWVPLVVTLPDSHPEEVAYGPEVMMDRLGKWLEKHFAAVQAQSKPVVWRKRTTLNGSPSDVFVYRDGPRDGEREKWEPLFLHPPRADVARLRAALQFMLENFEHGDLNAGEAAALDKARDALRGN